MKEPIHEVNAETVAEVKAAILLSGQLGGLELLATAETDKTSRRHREIRKLMDAVIDLLDMYPLASKHRLVELGGEFYTEDIEKRLSGLIKRGLRRQGVSLVPKNRWMLGDVLANSAGFEYTVERVRPEGYDVRHGKAVLYSEQAWPEDPYLLNLDLKQPGQERLEKDHREKEEAKKKMRAIEKAIGPLTAIPRPHHPPIFP